MSKLNLTLHRTIHTIQKTGLELKGENSVKGMQLSNRDTGKKKKGSFQHMENLTASRYPTHLPYRNMILDTKGVAGLAVQNQGIDSFEEELNKLVGMGFEKGHDHFILSIKTYLLNNFRNKAVAIGRVTTDAPFNDEAYNIIIDEFFDGSEMLFDRDRKFDYITVGEIINWPFSL